MTKKTHCIEKTQRMLQCELRATEWNPRPNWIVNRTVEWQHTTWHSNLEKCKHHPRPITNTGRQTRNLQQTAKHSTQTSFHISTQPMNKFEKEFESKIAWSTNIKQTNTWNINCSQPHQSSQLNKSLNQQTFKYLHVASCRRYTKCWKHHGERSRRAAVRAGGPAARRPLTRPSGHV